MKQVPDPESLGLGNRGGGSFCLIAYSLCQLLNSVESFENASGNDVFTTLIDVGTDLLTDVCQLRGRFLQLLIVFLSCFFFGFFLQVLQRVSWKLLEWPDQSRRHDDGKDASHKCLFISSIVRTVRERSKDKFRSDGCSGHATISRSVSQEGFRPACVAPDLARCFPRSTSDGLRSDFNLAQKYAAA